MTLHCENCGRVIGRTERETWEGETVCGRCFNKLKAAAEGADPQTPKRMLKHVIGAALATIVVVGTVLYVLIKLFGKLAE